MDKKAVIAVSLAIFVMLTWQWYVGKQMPPAQPPSASASPTPAVATATPAPAAPAPAPAAQPAPTPAPAPAAQAEIREVASPVVRYRFTNVGGGIADATLLNHLAGNGDPVVMNLPVQPIGGLVEKAGDADLASYSVREEAGAIVFERSTPEGVRITKRFVLPTDAAKPEAAYLVNLEVSFQNQGQQLYRSAGYFLDLGTAEPLHLADLPTYTTVDWFHSGKHSYKDVNWFSAGKIPLIGIQTSAEKPFFLEPQQNVGWAGVRNQYFTTILTPVDRKGSAIWAARYPLKEAGEHYGIMGQLGMPAFELKPGESQNHRFTLWIGPKEHGALSKLGGQQEEILNFGWFKVVSVFLLKSMNWLYSLMGNYAAAIFVLTLIIRGAMWPLQNKATMSMKRMQVLQPKMTELREKYKDDPQRMNQELMKLYRDYGVNPFSGCLPMLIQIPIFFGFYSMLGTAIELRNAGGGLFWWVKDLSQPDTVLHLGGFPLNILPLLMAATMVWQMSLTPKTGDPVQQRIFMFVPLIFVIFCYNFASALALYWTVQNLFSIVQLYLTRNQPIPTVAKVAAPARKKK